MKTILLLLLFSNIAQADQKSSYEIQQEYLQKFQQYELEDRQRIDAYNLQQIQKQQDYNNTWQQIQIWNQQREIDELKKQR